eukprot:3172678-Prorocentrum_lima.AAC.1
MVRMLSAGEDEETCQVRAHEASETSLTPQGRRRLEDLDLRQIPRGKHRRASDLLQHQLPQQQHG